MNDGTVIINGPTTNHNGTLDYDGTFELNGGFLITAGSSGMTQAPSEQSTQHTVIMNYSQQQEPDTIIHLEDDTGKSIVTYSPEKEYQSVVISSPELKEGISYTLYSGGKSTGKETDGLYIDGEYQKGTKVINYTISSTITWLSEDGVTTGGNNFGHEKIPGPGFGQRLEAPQ